MSLGSIIKQRRQDLGIAQKELAEGICTQSLICRMEQGDCFPKESILKELETRLGFEENELCKVDYQINKQVRIEELKNIINTYLSKNDYHIIELLLISEEKLINGLKSVNDKAFFEWIKATISYHLYQDKAYALEVLTNIPLSKLENELVLEIINTLGMIYYENGELQRAISIYRNAVSLVDYSVNYKARVRLLLSYATILRDIQEYKNALSIISIGIELLIEQNSFYLLGDFYYIKGQIFMVEKDFTKAQKNFKLAIMIFTLQNNREQLNLSQLVLAQIDK